MEEILNIEYHVKQMVVKALNRTERQTDAADKLGIHVKSLYRYIRNYNIEKDRSGKYYIKSAKKRNFCGEKRYESAKKRNELKKYES